ncbi:MAG TPA: AtpZ/AtpI family protein [Phycisphaeraceae bacterium]|nr:AtpZ/AtpI family protein [Phycisphaeraceae bacterium]
MRLFPRTKKKSERDIRLSARLYRISGMGSELVGSILGMALLGYFADRWFSTKPYLLMTGALLGLIGGFYNFLKQALRENRDMQKQWKRNHPGFQNHQPTEDMNFPENDENDSTEYPSPPPADH